MLCVMMSSFLCYVFSSGVYFLEVIFVICNVTQNMLHILSCLPKARISEPERSPLLGSDSVNMVR
jgi:hypothetical protein